MSLSLEEKHQRWLEWREMELKEIRFRIHAAVILYRAHEEKSNEELRKEAARTLTAYWKECQPHNMKRWAFKKSAVRHNGGSS